MSFLLTMGLLAAAAEAQGLRAGAAQVDVSPKTFPVIVNCGMLERTAAKLTFPLYARALVLEEGETKLAIVVVDSCMMPRELIDKAKELASAATGIRADRMTISATHTHSAPSVFPCLGSDAQPDYAAALPGAIADAIVAAHRLLQPAQAGWAVEEDWEHTHCRRWIFRADKMREDPFGLRTVRANMHPGYQNPDAISESGPVDPGLTVFSVQSVQGKPLALLANYSQHYFGDEPVGPDYYGRFARRMTELAGGDAGFVAMMSQGTSGDQMWMDYGAAKRTLSIEEYAAGVAESAMKAYRRIRYERRVPLAMAETKLTLRRRLPDAERLVWAKKVVAEMNGRKPKNQPEVYAREQLYLEEEPSRELKLQAIRIGGLNIHAIPNEVFALTGLKLKLQSPLDGAMNIELANGAEGYIPPAEQHRLGGYTTWAARSAGLETGAEATITEALLRLSEGLAGKARRSYREPLGAYAREVLESKPAAFWGFAEFGGDSAVDRVAGRKARYEGGIAFFLPGIGRQERAVQLAGGRIVLPAPELAGDSTVEFWAWSGTGSGRVVTIGDMQVPAGPAKQWQHIAIVRKGSLLRLYRNGVAEGGVSIRTSAPAGQITMEGFEGKLDELAVYARPLAAVEVSQHWLAGK
ncbi:MAG: hypothetical protein JNK48_26570 [Bryobacterales bacterium]|nr:hypothetical protein [Bryobacterales bacterium]